NAELGTSCASQGKPAPCIGPAQMSDLIVTAVPGVTTGIAAAGSNQGTATVLTTQINTVTMVPTGSGVVLPNPIAGQIIAVFNKGANVLAVYPPVSVSIDGLPNSAPVFIAAGSSFRFLATSATTYGGAAGGAAPPPPPPSGK